MVTSSNALIHAVKLILMSTGVVFIAVLLTPQIYNLTAAQLPSIWTSLRSWLRPPYLYVIINGIIITIAASSRLHHHFTHPPASPAVDSDEFRHVDHFRTSSVVSVEAYSFVEPKAPIPDFSVPTPEISPPPIPPIADFNLFYGEVLDQNHGAATEVETTTFGAEETKITERVMEEAEGKPINYDLAPVDGGSAEPEPMARRSMRKTTLSPPPVPAPLARQETFEVVSSFFQSQIEKPLPSARFAQNQRSSRITLTSSDETATFGGRQIGGVKEVKEEKVVNYNTAPLPPPPAPLARQETSEIVSSFFQTQIEKPQPSARFGHNRRQTKSTPEGGKGLRVAKSKRSETLESTWKTITEGRHMPLTRHLKKSDTWENHGRQPDSSDPLTPSHVTKADTFTDRTNYTAAAAATAVAKLKKDPSLSQDELNRRVEAFINKVNEDMKLQRQQSRQQFLETINRAK